MQPANHLHTNRHLPASASRRITSPKTAPKGSMSAVRATALRAGGACVRCRKGKTKCVYENGRAPCKNCSKGMHECYLPSESMSHGGHGVSPARAARARETLPSERASGAATGDRHGSAHPTTVVSRNSAPATEKYVCLFSECLYLCFFPHRHVATHLFSVFHGVCVMSTQPARIPCVASAVAAGSAMTACASSGSALVQLSSAALRHVGSRREPHTTCKDTHKSCSSVLHSSSPPSATCTTSAVIQGIRDDASYQGGLVHPYLLRLAPTSISFPYSPPAATVPRRAAASSGTQHTILQHSNPPPSLEVIAPTLDAPGQSPTRPPSLARE